LQPEAQTLEMEQRKRLLQIGNLVTPILCFVVIGFSGLDFSTVFSGSAYPNLINPAAWTFAIWGPIFIFQGLFYVYQARDLFRPKKIDMPYVHEVSVFFMLSWISTSVWYLLWGSGYVLPSVVAMYAYLLTSLGAYLRLGINLRERSFKEHVFVTVAWSMLAGWVTVATIVNSTTGFVALGFNPAPLGEAGWTMVVLAVALVIYLLVLIRRNDYVFTGVGLWALLGVLGERLDPVNAPQPALSAFAAVGIIVIAAAMVVRFYLQQKGSKTS
jgi:benzodiazapine receptor